MAIMQFLISYVILTSLSHILLIKKKKKKNTAQLLSKLVTFRLLFQTK